MALPRSNGFVTQAAMALEVPPIQKGYLILLLSTFKLSFLVDMILDEILLGTVNVAETLKDLGVRKAEAHGVLVEKNAWNCHQ